MASYKNYLITLLSLTTVASAYLAWQQSREVSGLRQTVVAAGNQSELRKRVWDAEKHVQSLESQLASAREVNPVGSTAPIASAPTDTGNRRGPGAFMGLMENPEYQKLMNIQQNAMLDGNYAALFRKLKLIPQQLEKFKQLLVERQATMVDLMAAARSQGLDPRTDPAAYRTLVQSTQAEIDQTIKDTLGESAYAEYINYETSAQSRNVVTQLEQRLSYSGSPLNESQGEQLLQILTASNQTRITAAGTGAALAGGGNVINFVAAGTPLVTDEVVARASGVLVAYQITALQQIQKEQEAATAMRRLVREQMGRGNRLPTPNNLAMPAFQLPNP